MFDWLYFYVGRLIIDPASVSYTHLDVYKRQIFRRCILFETLRHFGKGVENLNLIAYETQYSTPEIGYRKLSIFNRKQSNFLTKPELDPGSNEENLLKHK